MNKYDYITATTLEEKVRLEKLIKYIEDNLLEYKERYNNICKYLVAKDKYLNIEKDIDDIKIKLDELYKKKDDADLNKIYLWIKRCDRIIMGKEISDYKSSNLNLLLSELKIIRNNKFNEKELIQLFNKYGIYLVIEDALPSTKIRGCSMVKGNNPCIYITRYFKEKASFYFTLYHELGHVKKDYNRLKNKIIINDDDNEKDIDNYALNEMIDSNTWNKIKVNINDLEHICRENNIPLCFAYSRLAYEGIISYGSKEYNEHKEKIN